MPLQRDTVAIPVAKGIDVNTPARLVDAQELLEAQNARFTAKAGARKRRGHTGQRIRGAKAIPAGWTAPQFSRSTFTVPFGTSERNLATDWLLGYGYAPAAEVTNTATPLASSSYPDGIALGAAARDNETMVWDGNRLLSRTNVTIDGGQFAEFNAAMPALRSAAFAKSNIAQVTPDVADNGVIKVATWITGARAYLAVYDSALGTLLSGPTVLTPIGVVGVRAVPVGTWVHVLAADNDTGSLWMYSTSQSTPTLQQLHTLGDCSGYFDVCKIGDTSFAVAMSQTTAAKVRLLNSDGSLIVAKNWTPDLGGATGVTSIALCSHPISGNLGLAWRTATQVQAAQYSDTGASQGSIKTLGTVTSATRAVAIAPKYLTDSATEEVFNVYWDDWATVATLNIARWTKTAGVVYSASAFHMFVGSQGFRAGDRTYIWAARNSTYQSAWLLLDETLRPVGRAEYVVANTPSGTTTAYTNFSVSWWGTAAAKNRSVFHCGLSTRVRVPVGTTQKVAGVNPPAIYTEPYIKFARLDFLPPLRHAQAGRSTYFTGAQLWAYDGSELTEANFLVAPEGVTPAASGAGQLTLLGKYIYRVDLCYRNAQNEEIRSASFYTSSTTLAGAQAAIQLAIPTVVTRRANSYFLIFRNESNGTVWYLCNSRDPSSTAYLRNDQSVSQVTYTDSTVSDVVLITRELHPNQSFTHLDPHAPPAAEVIAAGRDRLWLAGGELPAGEVYPSRLYAVGEVPAFHSDLAIDVDRSVEAITGIGFVGDFSVFFRPTHNYILDNDGPDNESNGSWNKPRRSDSDLGPLTQESVAHIPGAIIFQSAAGIRTFTAGGGVGLVGLPVDSLARSLNITAAVVVGKDQEVRFYTWEGTTLVFNYAYGTWSTWTIAAAGAVRDKATDLVVLATPTGTLLREADGVWTDNGSTYKMRVRFSWLRAGNLLDFQQVRRIGAVGESNGNHSIHVDVYYNEREFAEEWFDWNYPDSSENTDTFGSGSFGDGNFGDDASVAAIQFRDSTWPWRRRLHRRKCSVISIAIDDNYTNGEGFTLTALTLELARKSGIDRTPWRGGSYTNTGGSGTSGTGN